MNADVKSYVEGLREAAALIEIAEVDVYCVMVGEGQAPYLVTVTWHVDSRRDAEELRDRLVDAAGVLVFRDEQCGPLHYIRLDSAECPQVGVDIAFYEDEEINNA